MTQKEKEALAKSMAIPIRCGGTKYIDGKLWYRLQGWLVPDFIVKDGWSAINKWQATHDKYNDLPVRRKK